MIRRASSGINGSYCTNHSSSTSFEDGLLDGRRGSRRRRGIVWICPFGVETVIERIISTSINVEENRTDQIFNTDPVLGRRKSHRPNILAKHECPFKDSNRNPVPRITRYFRTTSLQ